MRAIIFRTLIVSIACATPVWSLAQQPQPQPQQKASEPPPVLEPLEEGEEPAVTIRKEDGERSVTEKRQGGRVTEVKVKSGKSTYYLKPNTPAGSAQPGDAQSNVTRPPQWQIKEFDLGQPKKPAQGTVPDVLPPAPAAQESKK